MGIKTTRVSVNISQEDDKTLQAVAEKIGITKSEAIRLALGLPILREGIENDNGAQKTDDSEQR